MSPWVDVGSDEHKAQLQTTRDTYTWDMHAQDLALNTWVSYNEARGICAALKELGVHPLDSIKDVRQIVNAVAYGSNVLWMLDGVIALLATRDGAATEDK